ncbi:MAG: hypothetical protein MJA84_16785 [Firmicutes bacterium]|nr:hypothetical protein [Bacillota bacterium]
MCKGKPKTIRFEQEVEKTINQFRGNNFSRKLHNLVYHFKNTIPQRQQKARELDERIKEKGKTLSELNTQVSDLEWIVRSMEALVSEINYVHKYIENCNTKLKARNSDPSYPGGKPHYKS